ncbi:MAG TPA: RNA 3'-terminal phosphate cyclase [Burkholderiales bacterium]|nr:RNA 3'-terminal phosphate cyclase [Burkholderiales bacterium]
MLRACLPGDNERFEAAKADRVIEIDGSHGEGGGQTVRTAVALSAITGKSVRLQNVRANRDRPGLAPQHLAAVRAVGSLCAAEYTGLALRSQAFTFAPGALRGGAFRIDVGTAGSVTLVLQALLPVLTCAPVPSRVTVVGGTDVRAAPPFDYLGHVLLALLGRMGIGVECRLIRRGYYPRGGGEVEVTVAPARPRPLELDASGGPPHIDGLAHVANLPAHIAERMRAAALARLDAYPAHIDTATLGGAEAIGPGGAIVVWARAGETVLGAGRVAQRGVRAETLGDESGAELAADLAAGAALDVHAADQILVYLALAGGGGFTARTVSSHARTAIWLIEQFLPVRFEVGTAGDLARVEVRGR